MEELLFLFESVLVDELDEFLDVFKVDLPLIHVLFGGMEGLGVVIGGFDDWLDWSFDLLILS